MIGRGAVGNPFIFQDIIDTFNGRAPQSRTPQKRVEIYLQLIEENVAYYGERIGINRSRKTAGYWLSGFPNAATVRGEFVRMSTLDEVRKLLAQTQRSLY